MIFHAFFVRVRYIRSAFWIATLHVKCRVRPNLLVPGLPSPANMSWGTELWVSLLETVSSSTYLSLSFFCSSMIYSYTTTPNSIHVEVHRMLTRCFRQRVTRIPPKTSSRWQTTLTGVLPLRLLAAGDVLLSFGISPPFSAYPTPGLLIAVLLRFLSHEIFDDYRCGGV